MQDFKITPLAALLAATAAVPLLAAPRLCGNGMPPRLSGDAFSPVECSAATKAAAFLPGLPARRGAKTKADLRDLEGRWEGSLVHTLGRYQLLVTIKTSRRGKTTLALDMKELRFRQRLSERLSLSPSKQRGVYEAMLTTSLAPDASLKGDAILGAAAQPAISTPAAQTAASRQADLLFVNGAAHRIIFSVQGKGELRLRAFSGIPGAPPQTFETELRRTKRETL